MAQQQGKYLAKRLNAEAKGQEYGPFKFIFRGLMLYAGQHKSVVVWWPLLSGSFSIRIRLAGKDLDFFNGLCGALSILPLWEV